MLAYTKFRNCQNVLHARCIHSPTLTAVAEMCEIRVAAGEGDSGVAPIAEGELLTQYPIDRCVKVVIWCEERVRAVEGKVFKRQR